jgi:hypothetical protein
MNYYILYTRIILCTAQKCEITFHNQSNLSSYVIVNEVKQSEIPDCFTSLAMTDNDVITSHKIISLEEYIYLYVRFLFLRETGVTCANRSRHPGQTFATCDNQPRHPDRLSQLATIKSEHIV